MLRGSGAPQFLQEEGQVIGFGALDLRVEVIARWLCRMVIEAKHYSKRAVNNATLHLGVFKGRELVGIMQFGYAMNPSSAGRVVVAGTANDEYLELNRLWIHDQMPCNSESRALRFAFTLIKAIRPKVRWVQSFADERCKRAGVVYQASNFLYVGSHVSDFFKLDGEWYHKILTTTPSKNPNSRGGIIKAGLHRAERVFLRQFRYIYFLRPKYQRDLLLKVQPFPKLSGASVNG